MEEAPGRRARSGVGRDNGWRGAHSETNACRTLLSDVPMDDDDDDDEGEGEAVVVVVVVCVVLEACKGLVVSWGTVFFVLVGCVCVSFFFFSRSCNLSSSSPSGRRSVVCGV